MFVMFSVSTSGSQSANAATRAHGTSVDPQIGEGVRVAEPKNTAHASVSGVSAIFTQIIDLQISLEIIKTA